LKRGLVIQTAFLGDVILALPLVQVLKKSVEDSQVDFLAIPETFEILKSHPDISQVIVYDKHGKHNSVSAFLNLRAGLRKRVYDYVICPHRSLRSALLASGTGANIRVGFDRSASKKSFTHVMPWKFGVHEVERNLSLLKPLGVEAGREEPKLFPGDGNRNEVARFLAEHGVEPPYAVVAPGTAWKTKQYPPEMMAEVIRGLQKRFTKVVLIGGKKDVRFAGGLTDLGGSVVSAIGELPFMSSAEMIRRASLLVANDSAPVHIASAFNVPTVAIFGPTVKDFGFYPYHKRSKVVQVTGLGCRPCTIHGGNRCPIGTFECMRRIQPEEVLSAGTDLLEDGNV
jgi:lipopolysaccharide heptosyltransferase II